MVRHGSLHWFGCIAMEKRLEEQTKLAHTFKFAEFDKFKEENPFEDAPMRIVK